MTADVLSAIAGTILSLLFSYTPGLSDWFATLTSQQKSLVMLLAVALTAGGIFALACFMIAATQVACTKEGAWELIKVFFAVAVANQATFVLSPRKSYRG